MREERRIKSRARQRKRRRGRETELSGSKMETSRLFKEEGAENSSVQRVRNSASCQHRDKGQKVWSVRQKQSQQQQTDNGHKTNRCSVRRRGELETDQDM